MNPPDFADGRIPLRRTPAVVSLANELESNFGAPQRRGLLLSIIHRHFVGVLQSVMDENEKKSHALAQVEKALNGESSDALCPLARIAAGLRQEIAVLTRQQPINTHVRLFDLVRNQRRELHAADLITDEEYAWLSGGAPLANTPEGGSPSPRRLEDYDAMRRGITASRQAAKALDMARCTIHNALEAERASEAPISEQCQVFILARRDCIAALSALAAAGIKPEQS